MDNWFSKIIRTENDELKSIYITPVSISSDSDYVEKLSALFKEILLELSDVPDAYKETFKRYSESIIDAIDKQYSGDPVEAQSIIDSIIEDLLDTDCNIAVSDINHSISFLDLEDAISGIDTGVQFFRARKSDVFKIFERKEMLHIPFNKRDQISSDRFSIPGLPCLYLGSSSYCCWIEIGTPADHQFNVSAVKVDGSKKILNLTVNSTVIENAIDNSSDESIVKTLFGLWALTIATSFNVTNTAKAFRSEYIISQLLMLSCKKRNLYGIAYFSKQLDDDRFAHHVCVNLAVFADYNKESKLSEVCRGIKLSNSFNYSMYKNMLPSVYKDIDLNVQNTAYPVCIGNFERRKPYHKTEFYYYDKYLFAQLEDEIKTVDIDKVNAEKD